VIHHRYLIVGGGMAAAGAVRGIRERDADGSIGLIGEESDPPYKRPPLSKGLWKSGKIDRIWSKLNHQGLTLYLDRTAVSVDPRAKQVTDSVGAVYGYDRLLLATGGTPRRLPFGEDHIIYFRTLDDYRRLRLLADERQRFAVIGGGFIGSEIAAALRMNGKEVVLILPDDAIGANLFPLDLAEFVTAYYRQQGVDVRTGELAMGLERRGDQSVVLTDGGQEIVVDGVVAGIGLLPNIALAREAGLAVAQGIVVDEQLRTSDPDIFAAGDVAWYPDHTLGRPRRVEHEDNANTMGRHAGRAMAGEQAPYRHLSFFYSDLFDLGYEAVGSLGRGYQTVADWKEPYREGVVYYLRAGLLEGVLLWNVWGQVAAARELLVEVGPFQASDLIGRLPQTDEPAQP